MIQLRPEFVTLHPLLRLHELEIPVVGLTGGIATGKSTVSAWLRKKGLAVVDADALIKKIYAKPEVKEEIRKLAPDCVLGVGAEAAIDFKKLREHFFSKAGPQREIENILYPRLKDAFLEDFASLGAKASHQVVVYDVPLLFERGLDRHVDTIVCVYCPRELQKERLIRRDKISESLAEEILSKQMDIEEKRSRSQVIIPNIAGLNEWDEECAKAYRTLFK